MFGARSLALALALVACGPSTAPAPTGGAGGGGAGGAGGAGGGGAGGESVLGKPCVVDADCDDGIDCSFDACDPDLLLCRFTANDAACQDDLFCNGVEVCDLKLGCRLGSPVGCGDLSPCTIDRCDEPTKSCVQAPRDLDEDGDPDVHCGGGDCDDANPLVSSLAAEVCDNLADDDCDGEFDEIDCTTSKNDTCLEPLEIDGPGSYALSTVGAALDQPSSCWAGNPASSVDVVAALVLAPGPPVDVELTARTQAGDVGVAVFGQCGDPASEIACSPSYSPPTPGKLAKVLLRGVGDPAQQVALPVFVTTAFPTDAQLDVAFFEPQPPPPNETCGSALPLAPGVPTEAQIIGVAEDVATGCAPATGELVYSFTLDQPQNVLAVATSVDGDGQPSLSLRGSGCALPEDEITCAQSQTAELFWQSLPAGTYYLAVSATAPSTLLVTLELLDPTAPPADDACATAPPIPPNVTLTVDLEGHQDDHQLGCLFGAVDAAYELSLAAPSDVLLVERISQGDGGSVALSAPACDAAAKLGCGIGGISPVRKAFYDVPSGSWRVVGEATGGNPIQLTAFVRPAVPPVLVPFADGCADFVDVPLSGGLFQGNTGNATANFSAGCDQGGVVGPGAPDQLLRLVLPEPRRVVLDMAGSAYATMLSVREGDACPGDEVPASCTIGVQSTRSFLDLDLPAGTYWLQVDGYALASGPWFLDVYVADP